MHHLVDVFKTSLWISSTPQPPKLQGMTYFCWQLSPRGSRPNLYHLSGWLHPILNEEPSAQRNDESQSVNHCSLCQCLQTVLIMCFARSLLLTDFFVLLSDTKLSRSSKLPLPSLSMKGFRGSHDPVSICQANLKIALTCRRWTSSTPVEVLIKFSVSQCLGTLKTATWLLLQ